MNVLAADAAEAAGLQVVELSATVQQQFADLAPHLADIANPVDLGADAPPATIGRAVHALGSSGEADAMVVTLVATCTNDLPGALAALAEAADDQPHLPIVAVVVGGESPLKLGRRNLPVYELPEDAVRSLGHACRYAGWRRGPTGSKPVIPGIDRKAAQRIVAAAVADGAGWQPVEITRALMACYGIPLLETKLATSVDSAEKTARDMGFPSVMKATRPGLVHKGELGGVQLGLSDESAVRQAYLTLAGSLDEAKPKVALQRMVQTGVELVAGVAHDALFGSLVMVGLGGVHTDLLGDRSFRTLPLTDRDATAIGVDDSAEAGAAAHWAVREAALRKDDVLVHAYEVPLLPTTGRAAAIARGRQERQADTMGPWRKGGRHSCRAHRPNR